MAERHCKCLICKDGVIRKYSGTYNHLVNFHNLGSYEGSKGKIQLGVTHENTDEPTSSPRPRGTYKKVNLPQVDSNIVEVPCILQINILTKKRTVILGGSA